MKNKSKLNKIKSGSAKTLRNWFYMSKDTVTIEDLKEVWDENYTVEIWKEQGILEVSVENGGIDVEGCPTDFWDEDSLKYLSDHEVRSIFIITLTEYGETENRKAMEMIKSSLGGWFAADTDDFTPVI